MGVTAQNVTDPGLKGQTEPPAPKLAKPPLQPHRHIVWRGAALLLALMTAYLWWTRNFGAGLEGVPIVAALVAAFTFAFGIFGEGEQKWVKKRFFHFLLSTAFLVPVYVAEAVALFSTAPVIVLNSTQEPLTASLHPADSAGGAGQLQSSEKAAPLRLHIWSTTPLGRPYIIKVPGYAPRTIELAAPMGATISPERDLTPEIALIVRPGADAIVELSSGGSFHLFRVNGNNQDEIATAGPGPAGSLLVAVAPLAIPHDMVDDWRLELAGRNLDPQKQARLLRWWKTPRLVKLKSPADELTSSQKLRMQINSVAGIPEQCAEIEVPDSASHFVDLELHACKEHK